MSSAPMLDDWKINWEWRDLPPEAWDFIKRGKFFGMIIPKEYGGLASRPMRIPKWCGRSRHVR